LILLEDAFPWPGTYQQQYPFASLREQEARSTRSTTKPSRLDGGDARVTRDRRTRFAIVFSLAASSIPSQAKPAFLIDGRTGNGIMSPLLALITRQL
jgi:hypothetical protein